MNWTSSAEQQLQEVPFLLEGLSEEGLKKWPQIAESHLWMRPFMPKQNPLEVDDGTRTEFQD